MTSETIFLTIVLFTFPVLLIPKAFKHYYTLLILSCGIILTTIWSLRVFSEPGNLLKLGSEYLSLPVAFAFTIDRLSAFFIIVINITVLTGFIYSRGYLKPYFESKNPLRFSIHYISFLWLYLSMIMVVIIRDGLPFLIVWEIMAISSFFLVIFEAENIPVMKTGISYLIQMHVGMFFILIAFLIVERETGLSGFDALGRYFADHSNFRLFLLFFIGFGIKAGFVPLHTWLPQAHPAAPSHISGIMSGVMIKMGIYGIFRVLSFIQYDLLIIGLVILLVSLLTGIYGIMMSVVQNDIKRLLAFSSIENIGIIGIGTGLGVIGVATGNGLLGLLGFSGGLLHLFNHSLFKPLLFLNTGSVYLVTHTRNLEHLGGLMKKMPYTSILFLISSLAICGLPPFNGFISEYLIFMGLFKSLSDSTLYQAVTFLFSVSCLTLIGGLAFFSFSRAFGIAFLGQPRSEQLMAAQEVSFKMILPQLIPVSLILLVGTASTWFVRPVFDIVSGLYGLTYRNVITDSFFSGLGQISLISGIFIIVSILLVFYRNYHLKSKVVRTGPTWGCGYTAATTRQQYTANSFAYNYNHLAKPIIQTEKFMSDIEPDEIFPQRRSFRTRSDDTFKKNMIDKPVDFISGLLKKIAVMQTGRIQHYILYAFIFMILILLLTWLKII